MTDATYTIYGGANYALPEPGAEGESFDALDAALTEWLRRRNDWTGRYPLWGDGVEAASTYIIVLGTEAETFDGWSLVGAFVALGRDLDELTHYVEPADIAREAIAPTGSSDHQQVVWALQALDGTDEPAAAAIRREFPELDALVWDGSWLDLDAMGVDPEWVDELVREIEDTGEVEWIDGEPFLVGVDVLRRQLQSR